MCGALADCYLCTSTPPENRQKEPCVCLKKLSQCDFNVRILPSHQEILIAQVTSLTQWNPIIDYSSPKPNGLHLCLLALSQQWAFIHSFIQRSFKTPNSSAILYRFHRSPHLIHTPIGPMWLAFLFGGLFTEFSPRSSSVCLGAC
jgi:RsiW-degrading membrane proteinase PrsW (M82 family)